MNIIETGIEGLVVIEPKVFGDGRGYFFEVFNERVFAEEPDMREMTKYKNLAELYEKATDSGKHVADCARILVMRFN